MRLIDADRKPNKIYKVYAAPYASYYEGYIVNEFCIKEDAEKLALDLNNNLLRQYNYEVIEEDEPYENYPTVKAIPIECIKSKIDAILNIFPDGNEETEILCKLLYEWEKENGDIQDK